MQKQLSFAREDKRWTGRWTSPSLNPSVRIVGFMSAGKPGECVDAALHSQLCGDYITVWDSDSGTGEVQMSET